MDIRNMLLLADKARLDKGISKAEFYKRIGVSAAAVSQWKTGKTTPAQSTIENIASVLGVSVDDLTGAETKKDPVQSDEAYAKLQDMAHVNVIMQKIENLSPANREKVEEYIMLLAMKEGGGK